MDFISYFPKELTLYIFFLVQDPKSVCRCERICKRWNSFIKADTLWKYLFDKRWGPYSDQFLKWLLSNYQMDEYYDAILKRVKKRRKRESKKERIRRKKKIAFLKIVELQRNIPVPIQSWKTIFFNRYIEERNFYRGIQSKAKYPSYSMREKTLDTNSLKEKEIKCLESFLFHCQIPPDLRTSLQVGPPTRDADFSNVFESFGVPRWKSLARAVKRLHTENSNDLELLSDAQASDQMKYCLMAVGSAFKVADLWKRIREFQ